MGGAGSATVLLPAGSQNGHKHNVESSAEEPLGEHKNSNKLDLI